MSGFADGTLSYPLSTPFWADSRLERSANVHAVLIGPGTVLFCERTQRLFDLNETAEFIWKCVSDGLTCRQIARSLEQEGASPETALSFAVQAIGDWMAAGYVAPCEIQEALAGEPTACRNLAIGALDVQLSFFGVADPALSDEVFGHFASRPGKPSLTISVVGREGFAFVFANGLFVAMTRADNAIPIIKGLLTEAFCDQGLDGFIVHGALVSRGGRRLLLSGPPGAGKTTLTLALVSSGFSYASDDIARVEASGEISGIPFAAAVKSGAWDLLKTRVPDVLSLPVFKRADGQLARYVLPQRLDQEGAKPVDVVILLDRTGQQDAHLKELAPLDALRALIESGYSPRTRLEPDTLTALAAQLSRAACYRLSYGDLASALAVISGVA